MKRAKFYFIILIIFPLYYCANAQNNNNDSLLQILNKQNFDIEYLDALTSYAENIRYSNPDSTINMLKISLPLSKEKDYYTGVHSSLLLFGYTYLQKGDSELSKYYFDESLKYAEELDSVNHIASSYRGLGDYYEELNFFQDALKAYNKAIEKYEEVGDVYRLASVYNNMARCFDEETESGKVLEYYLKALRIFMAEGKRNAIAIARGNIASIYIAEGEYEKAKPELFSAIRINKELASLSNLAGVYVNLAIIYRNEEQNDSSLYYYDRAEEIYSSQGSVHSVIQVLFNKGQLLNQMEKYQQAVSSYKEGIAKSEELEFYAGIAYHCYGISEIYRNDDKTLDLAISNCKKSLRYSRELGFSELIQGNLERLYELNKQDGSYLESLEYFEEFKSFNDSVEKIKYESSFKDLSLEYENEKIAIELEKSRELNEQEKFKNTLYLSLVLILFVLAVVIAIISINLSRQKKLVRKQNEEIIAKNQRLKELDDFKDSMINMMVHDLKNPLNAIISITDDEELEIEDSRGVINMAGHRMHSIVMNILDVHKYKDKEEGMSIKPELSNLQDIFDEVFAQIDYLSLRRHVTIENKIKDQVNVYGDPNVLIRVFSNLLLNAIKYSNENSSIYIRHFYKMEDKMRYLCISVEDEGIGIEASNLKKIFNEYLSINPVSLGVNYSTGIGLTYCKLAVEAHNGMITAESIENKGTIINVFLPVH